MMFFVGSDHGGVELRDYLGSRLLQWGHCVEPSFGPATSEKATDYADVAWELCQALLNATKSGQSALGLLVCGTGQGMAISANKIQGIRAGVVSDAFSAKMIREHNNANVICLGQRVIGNDLAALLLQSFIDSEFSGERHVNRIKKVDALSNFSSN